jgi:general nucleoside transport system permease protein
LRSTYLGLWLTFAGEKPESLKTNGFSINKLRWLSLLTGGVLSAWGGATLSVYLASSYSPQMSGGRGFMALAALILGRWQPAWALLACLFFGFTDSIQIRLQGTSLFGFMLPVQWVQMIPYVVTIVALAGFLGRSRPPQALGR